MSWFSPCTLPTVPAYTSCTTHKLLPSPPSPPHTEVPPPLTCMDGFCRCPKLDVVCLGSCPSAWVRGSVSLKASITTLPAHMVISHTCTQMDRGEGLLYWDTFPKTKAGAPQTPEVGSWAEHCLCPPNGIRHRYLSPGPQFSVDTHTSPFTL